MEPCLRGPSGSHWEQSGEVDSVARLEGHPTPTHTQIANVVAISAMKEGVKLGAWTSLWSSGKAESLTVGGMRQGEVSWEIPGRENCPC